MTNYQTNQNDITIAGQKIEKVDICLGQTITLSKQHQDQEVTRRIRLSWAAFGGLNYV